MTEQWRNHAHPILWSAVTLLQEAGIYHPEVVYAGTASEREQAIKIGIHPPSALHKYRFNNMILL